MLSKLLSQVPQEIFVVTSNVIEAQKSGIYTRQDKKKKKKNPWCGSVGTYR